MRKWLVCGLGIVSLLLAGLAQAHHSDAVMADQTASGDNALPVFLDSHVGVSLVYDEKSTAVTPQLLYVSHMLTAGIGYNFHHFDSGNENRSLIMGHVGLRYCMVHRTFLTGGVSWLVGFSNAAHTVNSVVLGPFLGVDVNVTRHIMLTAQVMPYSYERSLTNTREDKVFKTGQIGFAFLI